MPGGLQGLEVTALYTCIAFEYRGRVTVDKAFKGQSYILVWKSGSNARLVVLDPCRTDRTGLQRDEFPASIHLAFDELASGSLPLRLIVRLGN